MKKWQRALFIFRRDLRIEDNLALIYALEHAQEVFCAFIFTQEQIEKNPYRSDRCLQFMIESLQDLEEELEKKGGRLLYCYGDPEKKVEEFIQHCKVDLVTFNLDYTPYSRHRDAKIEKVCKRHKVDLVTFHDLLLHPPEDLLKKNQEPYTVFTPFYKNAQKLSVALPKSNPYRNYVQKRPSFVENSSLLTSIAPKIEPCHGGRKAALKILKKISSFQDYEVDRDYPSKDSTTHLSAHLKFNTVSIRELYHTIKKELGPHSALARSLHWRDFFSIIALYFPYVFQGAFHQKFDQLVWSENQAHFHRWCEGKTGFPIVDAGMRQLNQTGYMHNRVRMIVASFLIKDLHIDWRKGEKYFAQHLVDYDPAINNGNWQWSASTGCDAQPYFRIFNPWNQQLKFDPDCEYIKKWVIELKDQDPKTIHHWYEEWKDIGYPKPMIDHSIESKKAIDNYKKIKS